MNGYAERGPVNDAQTFKQRCAAMREVAAESADDLVAAMLGRKLGDEVQHRAFGDRLYARLEDMSAYDLSLLVVLLLTDSEDVTARYESALAEIKKLDGAR